MHGRSCPPGEERLDPERVTHEHEPLPTLLSEDELKHIEKDVSDLVDEAVAFADASPEPPLEELFTDIFKES